MRQDTRERLVVLTWWRCLANGTYGRQVGDIARIHVTESAIQVV